MQGRRRTIADERSLKTFKRCGLGSVTWWCIVALGGLAVLLGGCSRQEFGRSFPRGKVPKALLTDTETGAKRTRSEQFAEVLAEWETQSTKGEDADYLVGAGDILEISVLALEAPDQKTAHRHLKSFL